MGKVDNWSTRPHFQFFLQEYFGFKIKLETPKSYTHFISARLVFHKKRVNWMFPFPLHKSSESKQRKKNWRLGARNRRKTFWCWGKMKWEVYVECWPMFCIHISIVCYYVALKSRRVLIEKNGPWCSWNVK